MNIYIINVVLLTILGIVVERVSKSRLILYCYGIYAWLQLTLIAALRLDVGIDYSQYYHAFYDIAAAQSWNDVFAFRYEAAYLVINRLISFITENIVVFMAIYYGIMYGLLMLYIFRYCEEKWIAILAYIALDYFSLSLCFMRQSMAMIIGLYAIEQIRRKKWYFAVPLILLAAAFHSSALILFLYFAASFVKWEKKWIQVTALFVSVLIYAGCDVILRSVVIGPFEKYKDYLQSQFMQGNSIMIVFYPVFCFVLFLIFRSSMEDKNQSLFNLVPMMFLGVGLTILSTKHYLFERIAVYMMIYNIRLVPMMVGQFRKRKQHWNYQLAMICVLIVSTSAFVFGMTCDRYWIVPYKIADEQIHQVAFFREWKENPETR